MECAICQADAKYRTVKGIPVCCKCRDTASKLRDHLNSTRTNPKSNFNPLGQDPVTLKEVIVQTVLRKEKTDETT